MMKKFLLIIIGLSIIIPQSLAQNLGSFTIYPTYEHQGNRQWIIREVNSGKTYEDKVTLENLTNEKITLSLDIFNGHGDENDFKLDEENKADGIAKWSALEEKTIQLNPLEKKQINIRFNLPTGIKEQKYSGALIASLSKQGQESSVKIISRIGTRIYLTVNNRHEIQSNLLNEEFGNINIAISVLACLGILLTLKPSHAKQNK